MRKPENTDIKANTVKDQITRIPSLKSHPEAEHLIEIITGETNISSAGFPYISDKSFRIFIEQVPHLFNDGARLLTWLQTLEKELTGITDISYDMMQSIERAIKVLRTVVFTAAITAPPDLWLLKQVLSTHKELGILDRLISGYAVDPEEYAREKKLNFKQLKTDLHFLYSRGYLRKGDGYFLISKNPAIASVLENITVIEREHCINFVPALTEWFSSSGKDSKKETFLRKWLRLNVVNQPTHSWVANLFQIELGYRLLPLILSLRVLEITKELKNEAVLKENLPAVLPEMREIFEFAGFLNNGNVSELGARVFARGPGSFGIIGAYYPYLNHLKKLLTSKEVVPWVHRGDNVAASQDANWKTFKAANDQLELFCKIYHFHYTVFIEHAVGQGEATRQRFIRNGEKNIKYFGADLEDAAIDEAIKQQGLGILPQNMQFIRSADIGEPEKVINFLKEQYLANEPTVMMVGNGFHEIRKQTNKKMIAVFKLYQRANFLLIFTEESALHDEALIHTAWNTYHAGFRYVHEISGQGLRPAVERESGTERWSWRKCALQGGYIILDKFSHRSRTIYPYKRPKHKNPSISVTYFCVPREMAIKLGIEIG